ncbi:MAG: DUF2130 domain-containing protein [Bacilli bacterium]|nr:DUF2130 domain-containing protein [Bacilli bacterium]
MNELKCPKCGAVFQVNETDYESIARQVRDKEFEKAIKTREEQHKKEEENAIKLAETTLENKLMGKLSEMEKQYNEKLNQKALEITELKSKMQIQEKETELIIKSKVAEKEKEIDHLNNELKSNENRFLLAEKTLRETYEVKIKDKEEQIAYYKDFKAKQSTKMIGESLEQHCNDEFNRLRPLFKNAYFEKDNDIKTGSKGDFIYRDFDEAGIEITSIMFEMKNEGDETASKHKNEDFLKELDKDRREKKCEYAVLVSLLEIDSEYYNSGIVDMSHRYDKMYVIRPQFFIPLITLIRGIAIHSLEYKKELQEAQNQNVDISNFEDNINSFKQAFGRNYRIASEKFQKAIDEIDKTIDHLQKTRDALVSSENNLRLANNKAEDLTIKKLTSHNETMKKMFDELKNQKKEEATSTIGTDL